MKKAFYRVVLKFPRKNYSNVSDDEARAFFYGYFSFNSKESENANRNNNVAVKVQR